LATDIGIPRFYFPKTQPDTEEIEAFQGNIRYAFAPHGGAVTVAELHALLPKTCDCPGYLAYQLADKISVPNGGEQKVTVDAFVKWWSEHKLIDADSNSCAFQIVKQEAQDSVTQDDLLTFMQHVLRHHPGLEFLQVRSAAFPVLGSMSVVSA
jgi:hypothetical protein